MAFGRSLLCAAALAAGLARATQWNGPAATENVLADLAIKGMSPKPTHAVRPLELFRRQAASTLCGYTNGLAG